MADYVTRAEFDQLLQQLRSAPGSSNLPVFQGIPQVLDREGVGLLEASTGSWQTFYQYSARGGLLLPDRILDLAMVCGLVNTTGGAAYLEYRVRIGDEVVVQTAAGLAPDPFNGVGIFHFRLLQDESDTQIAYIDAVVNTLGIFYSDAHALDLSGPWTLSMDVRFDIPDPGLLSLSFARNHALLTLL